ncbi:hypothetical protein D3C79_800620 [compost metagenome]
MADGTELEQLAAPLRGHAGHCGGAGQVVIAACRQQAWERQRAARQRRPAMGAQAVRAGVALRPVALQVRGGGEQGALDRALITCGPVHHHQHTGTVRDQDHRAIDCGQFTLDRLDPRRATERVGCQRQHGTHLGQASLQQGLPMFCHMVAQTGNDQHGSGGLQFFHVRALCSGSLGRLPTA